MVNEDVKIAWITVTFLNNRRVLFVVGRTEIPRYYIKTVYEIRNIFTDTLSCLPYML